MILDKEIIKNTKEAEQSLLASFILSPDTFNAVGDWFTESDFYDAQNGIVFSAIKSISDEGTPIDIISISQKLKNTKNTEYAVELMGGISSAHNYEYYANLVKEFSTKRKLAEAGELLTQHAIAGTEKSEDIIKQIEQKLADVTATTKGGGEINTQEVVDEVLSNIQRLKDNPQEVVGITTGFHKLDMKLSGLHKTDLIILAARPARGKSAFALQLARNVTYKAKVPTLFFSLEMGADQLVRRLIALESKIDSYKLRSGGVSDKEMEIVSLSAEIIKKLPLYFNDKMGVQIKDIRSQIKLHNSKNDEKIGFIIVDYLQLMATGKNTPNMVQEVTEISRGLKTIAKEFGVPVLALSQLSRNVESRGGKPKLSDLRDSGSIEQDADIVMFLHSETTDEDSFGQKDIELLVEKHRNGPTGSLSFKFDSSKMNFIEVEDIKE